MKRWPTKPLEEIAEVYGGSTPSRDNPAFWDGNIPWVTPTDLPMPGEGISIVEKTKDRITETGLDNSSATLVPKGTVLFSSRATIGKVAVAGMPLTTNQGFVNFVPHPEINSRFLAYALWFHREDIARLSGSTTFKEVNRGTLRKYRLPVPSLTEQGRIVKLLDQADELRKLRAAADRRTAALVSALFHEMFNQADFVEKTVGQFLEEGWLSLHKDGNHGSLYPRSSEFGSEGIPFLSATCITDEGTINHSEVKRLAVEKAKLLRHGWIERGDVLLAHNASVGEVGFYEGDYDRAIIGTSLTAFRVNPDRIVPRFLWAALRDFFFQRQLQGIMKQALRNQVPITAQRKLFLRGPPLALQQKFAVRVDESRLLEAEQAASRRRLDDLFQSMLHRAFNGEL